VSSLFYPSGSVSERQTNMCCGLRLKVCMCVATLCSHTVLTVHASQHGGAKALMAPSINDSLCSRCARAAGVAAWRLRWHCSSAQLWWPRRQHQPAGVQYHRLWRGAAGRRAASGGRRRIGQHEHGRRSWRRRRRGAAQGQAQEARPRRAMKRSDQAAVLGGLGSLQCMLAASNFLRFACDACRCMLQHSRGEDAVNV